MAEAAGQEDTIEDADLEAATGPTIKNNSKWCCLYRIISLQDDFVNEKPMIQHFLETRGHECIFYPKFHCEFNSIEMLWGYAKYREFSTFSIYLGLMLLYHLQDFALLLMVPFQQQRFSFLNVFTWQMSSPFSSSSGDTSSDAMWSEHNHTNTI